MSAAAKYSSTSTGIGAAPTTKRSHSSSPSAARTASFGTPPASSAAFAFSHTRGTAPKIVGCTSRTTVITSRGSGQHVSASPYVQIAVYPEAQRSAMWALGRNDTARPGRIEPRNSSIPRSSASMFAWVVSTPLGGPVVPDV